MILLPLLKEGRLKGCYKMQLYPVKSKFSLKIIKKEDKKIIIAKEAMKNFKKEIETQGKRRTMFRFIDD